MSEKVMKIHRLNAKNQWLTRKEYKKIYSFKKWKKWA